MTQRPSAADRLLATASDLFAREGIRSVGIDRVLAEAGVAKATLYGSFGSKEALVVATLERRDAADRATYLARVAELPAGPERVLASFDLAEEAAARRDFVGCVYANALNEFPDRSGPIAGAVFRHRAWVRQQWVDALAGRPDAEHLASEAQIAYDGALLGAKAAGSPEPIRIARALLIERLARTLTPNA